MPSLSRRKLLGLTALGFASGLAGCNQSAAIPPNTTTRTTTPAQQSTATATPIDGRAGPAKSCTGEYASFHPGWVVEGPGPLGGFDLTLNQHTLTRGATLTASLRNVTDEPQTTGNKQKYDVQYKTSKGWRTIFGLKDNYIWTDEGVGHKPGHGFTWRFPIAEDGLSTLTDRGNYGVCTPLAPGTYRFVYWGITTEQEAQEDYETDYALGVPFTVTDD